MNNNFKTLIVGRTGSGKDYLARLLIKEGFSQVLSYTTRPKRTPTEDTHIFVSQKEADAIPASEKVATTVINGYEYFATRQQVEENDIYIIDPNGLYELMGNMPDTPFLVVYVEADRREARDRALARSSDPAKELAVYMKRCEAEDAQFTAFEKELEAENQRVGMACIRVKNDYLENGTLENAKTIIVRKRRQTKRLIPLAEYAIKNRLYIMQDDKISIYTDQGRKEVTTAQFLYHLTDEPDDVGNIMLDKLGRKAKTHIAEGFAADLAEMAVPEEFARHSKEILDLLPLSTATDETSAWFKKLYDLAAKYI